MSHHIWDCKLLSFSGLLQPSFFHVLPPHTLSNVFIYKSHVPFSLVHIKTHTDAHTKSYCSFSSHSSLPAVQPGLGLTLITVHLPVSHLHFYVTFLCHKERKLTHMKM